MFTKVFINTSWKSQSWHKFVDKDKPLSWNCTHKLSKWKDDRKKYSSMSMEQKRKLDDEGNYKTLADIPTWKDVAQNEKLGPKIEMLPNCSIDDSKNSQLAKKISYIVGDITKLKIDAIVNAADNKLLGGGGVDGAIHKAAGGELKEECRTLNGCKTGDAKITGGYKLPAKYVIHTVGPVGEKPDVLKSCYSNTLKIMLEKKLGTVAFPCISTGVYRYPNEAAAHIAAYTVRKHLEAHADSVDRIIFCLFLAVDVKIYQGLLQSYFPLE